MVPSPRPSLLRRLLVGSLVLLALGSAAAAPAGAAGEPDPSGDGPTPYIVGGGPAPVGAWPSQVALLHSYEPTNYYAQFCGGTLIARSWVLTAGHCVRDIGEPDDPGDDFMPRIQDVDVLVGTQDLTSGGVRIPAVELRPFPAWLRYDWHNDLALIRLDRPAPANVPVQPITVQGSSPSAGAPVTVTGWGTRAHGEYDYPNELYQVEVNVTTATDCENGYPGFYQQSTMVCAAAPGKDACQGDSGGPMLQNRGGTWVQVGIISTGDECALEGFPGVYTKLAAYSDWIKQQIRYGPQPAATNFVTRQYLDAYDRVPTTSERASGLASLDGGQLPEAYVTNLLDQPGFQTRTGGVIRLYQAVFLRRPETAGLAYWWREVNRGVSLKRVAALMVGAPEFEAEYGALDDTGFVELVYDNVLGRAAASNEIAYWVDELDSGRRSRGQVMVGFSESPELKARTTPDTRVIGAYFALLRRVPGEDDITFWGGRSAQSLVGTIIKGYEYAFRF